MENSNLLQNIVKILIYMLFFIFIIVATLKLTNHSPTFEQTIMIIGSMLLGHQFYLAKKISKLEGKFEMFEKEFKEVKTELKDFRKEFMDFKEEFINFKHEIRYELKALNKSLA